MLMCIFMFVKEHGHEFNADHALQELYDYVKRYQDQVGIIAKILKVLIRRYQ